MLRILLEKVAKRMYCINYSTRADVPVCDGCVFAAQ